jgi:hypothetical protein
MRVVLSMRYGKASFLWKGRRNQFMTVVKSKVLELVLQGTHVGLEQWKSK